MYTPQSTPDPPTSNSNSAPSPSFWPGVLVGAVVGNLSVLLGAQLLGAYTNALFIGAPIVVGFLPPVINGRRERLTFRQALTHSAFAALLSGIGVLLWGLEGLICIAMAFPIVLPGSLIGGLLGNSMMLLLRDFRSRQTTAIVTILLTPFITLFESEQIDYHHEKDIRSHTTSIIIDAPPERVWPHVIAFPDIHPPHEFLFRAGISYPVRARIEGTGPGAVRYCEFSTGDFIEPITVWDEPYHLAFDVTEVAPTMTELSPWNIEPHHLHGYFVSTKGEFRLERLPGNRTRLSGTTWYYQRMSPRAYWDIWGDYIVGKIHVRVLEHIRRNVE